MEQEKVRLPQCAECSVKHKICLKEEGQGPQSCPTVNFRDVVDQSVLEYQKPKIKEFAPQASIQEGECYTNRDRQLPYVRYPVKPRIQETIEFANKMGFKRLGLAFCSGVQNEAGILSEVLGNQGLEVVSVSCKVGRTSKEILGIRDDQKVRIGKFEAMCSPIAQAQILNKAKTDFNIMFGLCVGHDSLFMRYSDALCTTLVVKDRVTGHNPIVALYQHWSYYGRLKKEQFGKGGAVTCTVHND